MNEKTLPWGLSGGPAWRRQSAPGSNCLRPFAEGRRSFSQGGEQRGANSDVGAKGNRLNRRLPTSAFLDSLGAAPGSNAKASTLEELEQERDTSTRRSC
jgi:hypothetical protein